MAVAAVSLGSPRDRRGDETTRAFCLLSSSSAAAVSHAMTRPQTSQLTRDTGVELCAALCVSASRVVSCAVNVGFCAAALQLAGP